MLIRAFFLHRVVLCTFGAALLLSLFSGLILADAVSAQLLHKLDKPSQATDFTLPDLDGEQHTLSVFKGKVVIVNFWATWCPPCRDEIPSLQRAWNKLKKKDVKLLAVHVGGDEDTVWTFLNDFEIEFPVLLDQSGEIAKKWPMHGLPVTFIIDPKGKMVLRAIGGRKWDHPDILRQILNLRTPTP